MKLYGFIYQASKQLCYSNLCDKDIAVFEGIIGKKFVLTNEDDIAPYNSDWLRIYKGNSRLVLQPQTSVELADILKVCDARRLPVCPQSGNTGLVGGSVPVKDEIIITLRRLNKIIEFDDLSGLLTCESGCILENLDRFVSNYNYQMPVDLGAKGSCFIGGNLATAAGGVRFARYGNFHSNAVGLEVVLADGNQLNLMTKMRKDNTGLHLLHNFIGSEGILGIITKAIILCPTKPNVMNTAFLGCNSFEKCLSVLKLAKKILGETLMAFEFMDRETIQVVNQNLNIQPVLASNPRFNILIEVGGACNSHDIQKLETFLEKILDQGLSSDGTIAQDHSQMKHMWCLRENATEALRIDGYCYKQDLTLPLQTWYDIVEKTRERLGNLAIRVVAYGHLADGNIHLNITSKLFDSTIHQLLYPFIFDFVRSAGGSISAEHGIGQMKRKYLHYNKSIESIDLMRKMKTLFDPKWILNPYKVIPD